MLKNLREVIDESKILKNVDMKKHTTFKTGGMAETFIVPESVEDIKNVLKFLYEAKIPYYILGNGSNLLVSDDGLKTPVISIGKTLSGINVFENCITAYAGATLAAVSKVAIDESLARFEFAAGIPGTVGGAIIMNAGAYGGEMKQVTEAVRYIDPSGEEHVATGAEMEFGYRNSALMDTNCIITSASFVLEKGNSDEIREKMAELSYKRKEKQPLEYPSAGSTFKRPAGYFAGQLIETTGLKGYSIGGAQVSEKHAGFVINKGNATTKDIIDLISYIQEKVYEKHNVFLEPEVKYWSD